jgi:hypothetical protein
MAGMAPDSLLRRVRWANVARVLALPAIALAVALWPRLSAPPPRAPAAEASPVAPAPTPTPTPAAEPEAQPETAPEPEPARAPGRARTKPRAQRPGRAAPA